MSKRRRLLLFAPCIALVSLQIFAQAHVDPTLLSVDEILKPDGHVNELRSKGYRIEEP